MASMTEKQKRFVEEYLVDLNAAQAAIRAGYSPRSAKQLGCMLLQKPHIQEAVEEAKAERARRLRLTQDKVVEELRMVAFADASDESGSELRYAGKLKALEMLGKHLGMFTDKVDVDGEMKVKLSEEVKEMAR